MVDSGCSDTVASQAALGAMVSQRPQFVIMYPVSLSLHLLMVVSSQVVVQDWVVREALTGKVLPEAGVGVTQTVSQTLVVMVEAEQLEVVDDAVLEEADCELDWSSFSSSSSSSPSSSLLSSPLLFSLGLSPFNVLPSVPVMVPVIPSVRLMSTKSPSISVSMSVTVSSSSSTVHLTALNSALIGSLPPQSSDATF